MDYVGQLERIKKLSIIAMFSDDYLMDILVLKGGNAIDIVYGIASRSSLDLDFSIATEFNPIEMSSIKSRFEKALNRVFDESGYKIFDIKFGERPEDSGPDVPPFWGGYRLEFKLIDKTKYVELENDVQRLRLSAVDVGPGARKTYRIEISKWEYCDGKNAEELDDYTVYVYTPTMIVFEKLRAICQQMPEYSMFLGKSYETARARDFFDIHTVVEHFNINLTTSENLNLLRGIFKAKEVPINLIGNIKEFREHHRQDFIAVENTVKPNIKIKDFDYYFDYVVNKCNKLLEALGEI
ncbi:MAG: nucleotidyl transferase AbiEii/AbiGii toxin family protein [Sedimentisphaerales bacterium]